MKYFLCSIILVMLIPLTAGADDITDVEKLLKPKIDQVISVLKDKSLDHDRRKRKIVDTINSIFDFELMARLSLGKKHWLGVSEHERKKFTSLFIRRIQDSYVEKMGFYDDEVVVYEKPKKVKKRVHVMTYLSSKEHQISILYKLYQSKKGWLIYDLEIEGVSFIKTFQSQFDGFLKKGTFAGLLEKLRAPDPFSKDTPEKIKNKIQ